MYVACIEYANVMAHTFAYLNKSVQVYLGTDYPVRDGLRTESFPNTSHSQRAVTVIPCMSYMTGRVVGALAPLELTSPPGSCPDSRYCQAAPGSPTYLHSLAKPLVWSFGCLPIFTTSAAKEPSQSSKFVSTEPLDSDTTSRNDAE